MIPFAFVVEVIGRDKLDPLRFREFLGARADQKNVRRLLHHQARQVDRIRDVLDRSHRSRAQRAPVHNRRVKLGHSLPRVISALPRIKQAGVFHHAKRGFYGVDARPAGRKNTIARLYRFSDHGAPRFDLLRRRSGVIPGATVHH